MGAGEGKKKEVCEDPEEVNGRGFVSLFSIPRSHLTKVYKEPASER